MTPDDFPLTDPRYQAGVDMMASRIRDVIYNERNVQERKRIDLDLLESYLHYIVLELKGEFFPLDNFSELHPHILE